VSSCRATNANASVCDELGAVGVPVVDLPEKERGEVPSEYQGRLGSFTFRRSWYYWTVRGRVPFAVAKCLYAHPAGAKAVRVDGHCGAPEPTDDVWVYDVDTAAGLRLLVDTIRAEGLHVAP